MYKSISLLSLQTFSTTGGIQKMSRTLAHSLNIICNRNKWHFKLSSLYDAHDDLLTRYLPADRFEGFNNNRLVFLFKTLFASNKPDVIILTHINLAVVGLLSKLFNPKCEIWLVVHGIEVWRPLGIIKKLIFKYCSKILCVSSFTKQQLYNWHKIELSKCVVLNNAIDPFIKLPSDFSKPPYLLNRYGLEINQPVIFTLSRLASTEQYKGYDRVLQALNKIKEEFPNLKYIISGQYDLHEGQRVRDLIFSMGLSGRVILTGFIKDEELTDHFLLADLFVLPSKKEGFGIVFIEALACGLPVICGNADGSIDAIRNGELGVAINADDEHELEALLTDRLSVPLTYEKRAWLKTTCLKYFNEEVYIDNLQKLLLTNADTF